jgi:hypothetical protein
MIVPKKTQKDRAIKIFSGGFGKRNAQPMKRSPLWDEPTGQPGQTGHQSRNQAGSSPAEVIYGTAALRGIRIGIFAACLALGALHWNPRGSAIVVLVPALLALFWDNKRWIFRGRELDIEYSNVFRTKVVPVRASNFLKVDKRIIKGSGSETFQVTVVLSSGGAHNKDYPTEHEADLLVHRVVTMFRPNSFGA